MGEKGRGGGDREKMGGEGWEAGAGNGREEWQDIRRG